jgi:hypothetical protein
MNDDFINFISDRRTRIVKRIHRLERELNELERTERLYRMSQKTKDDPEITEEQFVYVEPREVGQHSGPSKIGQALQLSLGAGTIKQAVLEVLREAGRGLTSDEILQKLNTGTMPTLARTSLSPQLSRLRHADHLLTFRDGCWYLSEPSANGLLNSFPSDSSADEDDADDNADGDSGEGGLINTR